MSVSDIVAPTSILALMQPPQPSSNPAGALILVGLAIAIAFLMFRLGRVTGRRPRPTTAIRDLPDPDASTDLDREILVRLERAGANLAKPHGIDFYLYFSAEASAREAARQIQKQGFKVRVQRSAQGTDWLCFATKTLIPRYDTLTAIRRNFEALAAIHGGEYDSWGTYPVR
ncbi:MAG TPA: ribonuclease E inhibitor RraB [Anaerolineae bacterium]|nr:ribonuclease E inhibitor RraB [Anaerolineae bacterium]